MPKLTLLFTFLLGISSLPVYAQVDPALTALKAYPFPNELVAATTGTRIAWACNENGQRNIYVAEGPSFQARRLTNYATDDGQELTQVALSPDGKWVIYVRGGDHGSNWDDELPVNPLSLPLPPKVQLWSVPFSGGVPKVLGEAVADPVIAPNSTQVAYAKNGQIYVVPIDGSAPAKTLFTARGSNGSPQWSPDGRALAFQSNRGDHAFIGIYRDGATPLVWLDPQFKIDATPRWSPDGRQVVFVRYSGEGGVPDSILQPRHVPWQLLVADATTGLARPVWKAPNTIAGSPPSTHGGVNLHWAQGHLVFLSYHDGWPHLYALPEAGGPARLLTPGDYMCEHIRLSADGQWLVCAANTGPDALDIDRRHVLKIEVASGKTQVMTPGTGLEWSPVLSGNGQWLVYLSATPQRPPLPAVQPAAGGPAQLIGSARLPGNYPLDQLVTPRQVKFSTPDGLTIHAQLFEPPGATPERSPAIVYIHGGPPRQMLLGWHYSDYYANAYALNQYLASQGMVVLSVNYRLGIGYGRDFQHPARAGTNGAAEYTDIKAAGEWLAQQPFVDPQRIGVYGGSYGGYLTALALGRDSRLFAAGVDIHGVHERTGGRVRNLLLPDRYEKAPDAAAAVEVSWQSSPAAAVPTWTSPVLLIHGDDDRNVRFSQTTDLVKRLEQKGIPLETLVIVDDTHHFMRHANQMRVNQAVVDFFRRQFLR